MLGRSSVNQLVLWRSGLGNLTAATLMGGLSTGTPGSLSLRPGPTTAAVSGQVRFSSTFHNPQAGFTANREEDKRARAFLASYCPYEILGLDEGDAKLADIKSAHRRLLKYYSPTGPNPDKKKFDLVDLAFEVLTTPTSPHFNTGHAYNADRHDLYQEILNPMQRSWNLYYSYALLVLLVGGLTGVFYTGIRPSVLAIHQIYRVDKLHQWDPVTGGANQSSDPADRAEEHYGHIK